MTKLLCALLPALYVREVTHLHVADYVLGEELFGVAYLSQQWVLGALVL